MRRFLGFSSAFAVYAMAALLIFYRPGIFGGHTYLGEGSDPSLYIWMFQFLPDALVHLQNPLVISRAWAPFGLNILQATTTPGIALLAWPLTNFFNPIISFSVISILTPAFSAFSAFLFVSVYTKSWFNAFFSGLTFGFSTYIFASMLGHLQVDFVAFLPIAFFAVAARSTKQISYFYFSTLLTISIIFQFLCSLEIFVMQSIFLFIFAIFNQAIYTKDIRRLFIIDRDNIIYGVIFSYIYSIIFLSPLIYTFFSDYKTIPHSLQYGSLFSTNLANLVIPTPITWIFGHLALPISQKFAGNFSEQMGYIGFPLLLIVAISIIRLKRLPMALPLIALLVSALVCSLGPELHILSATIIPLPWALIDKLPFLQNALPSRLMVFVMLAISGLIALWLETIERHRLFAFVALACAMVFTLPSAVSRSVDWWQSRVPTARLFEKANYKNIIGKGKIVLFLPFGPTNGDAMFWQTEANGYFRMVNGYGNFVPPALSNWPVANMLEQNLHPPGFSSAFNEFAKALKISKVIVPRNQLSIWNDALVKAGWVGSGIGRLTVFSLPHALRQSISNVTSYDSRLAFDQLHFKALWQAASCLLKRRETKIDPQSAIAAGCLNAGFAPQAQPDWDRLGGWLGRYGRGIGVGVLTNHRDAERLASEFGAHAQHIYFPYPKIFRPKSAQGRMGQLLIVSKPDVFLRNENRKAQSLQQTDHGKDAE